MDARAVRAIHWGENELEWSKALPHMLLGHPHFDDREQIDWQMSLNRNPLLPPNPCLIAVLLLTQTASGSHFVFHYPPNPSISVKGRSTRRNWFGTTSSAAQSFDTDSVEGSATFGSSGDTYSDGSEDVGFMQGSSDEEEDLEDGSAPTSRKGSKQDSGRVSRLGTAGSGSGRSTSAFEALGSGRGGELANLDGADDRAQSRASNISRALSGTRGKTSRRGDHSKLEVSKSPSLRTKLFKANFSMGSKQTEMPWDNILGFPIENLEKLLVAHPGFHKKRFEVCVDGIVFLGAPIFARADGSWRKHSRRKKQGKASKKQHQQHNDVGTDSDQVENPEETGGQDGRDKCSRKTGDQARKAAEVVQGFEPGYGHDPIPSPCSDAASEMKHDSTGDDITMFNIVFVLEPPQLEYNLRVEEMYDNVTKRLARTLKPEQDMSNYVSEQVQIIMKLKEQAKLRKAPMHGLWVNILQSSSLAKSLAIIYEAISISKIAHITMENGSEISFQIPEAVSISYIPTLTEPKMSGLWLTTANLIDDADQDFTLSPHSALLLLEDKEILMKEIETDAKELSGPLLFFVRDLTPTRSLKKLAAASKMTIKDALFLATHLIYWRRARAIPPLHHRDTYTVSPLANMRSVGAAVPAFATRFPTFPTLPKMLNLLSTVPRPYGQFIPTKDHRGPYMEILAWLFRGGWVTQLRMFAWVRVPVEVKTYVDAKIELEKSRKSSEAMLDSSGELSSKRSDPRHLSPRSIVRTGDVSSRRENRSSDSSSGSRKPLPTHLGTVSAELSSLHLSAHHPAWIRCRKHQQSRNHNPIASLRALPVVDSPAIASAHPAFRRRFSLIPTLRAPARHLQQRHERARCKQARTFHHPFSAEGVASRAALAGAHR